MSTYTTTVRTICESYANQSEPQGYESVKDIINVAAPLVFDFDFPIWDENYRATLEQKILKHYYMREIGAETVGLWKLYLDEKLNLIMPYYNKLYETTVIEFNPLYDVDLTTDHDGNTKKDGVNASQELRDNKRDNKRSNINTKNENTAFHKDGKYNSEGEAHETHTGSNVNRYSDTPQGALTEIEANHYLTNATLDNDQSQNDSTNKRKDNNTDDSTNKIQGIGQSLEKGSRNENEKTHRMSHDTIDTTDKYIQHVVGANGNRTYSAKILEFRQTLINIDAMIIDELKSLFMGLWG